MFYFQLELFLSAVFILNVLVVNKRGGITGREITGEVRSQGSEITGEVRSHGQLR